MALKFQMAPQNYTLNTLWFQKEGAQIHVSERGQSLTFTEDMGRGFLIHSTLPTQWTIR